MRITPEQTNTPVSLTIFDIPDLVADHKEMAAMLREVWQHFQTCAQCMEPARPKKDIWEFCKTAQAIGKFLESKDGD